MSEQNTHWKPVEPTTPVNNPVPLRNPYEDVPIAPPPPVIYLPRKRWQIPWFVYVIGVCLVILISFEAGIIFYTSIPSKQTTPHVAATRVSTSLPTLDAKAAIQTTDFSQFIQAFAILMADKDYATIKSAADTGNFQAIPLDADGQGNWNDVYNQLITGNLSFVVQYPPITTVQEGYTACAYGKKGYPPLININAADVQYVVGTAIQPNAPSNYAQTASNGTVFIFELPNPTVAPLPWLWRGITYNNQIACIPT